MDLEGSSTTTSPSENILVLSDKEPNSKISEANESEHDDEFIEDEVPLDYGESKTPVTPINKNMLTLKPIETINSCKSSSDFHPLLADDVNDVFLRVSTHFLAGFSFQLDCEQPDYSSLTFHFFTDYIDTETACQWQVSNKNTLTCEILVHNQSYLDKGVILNRIYQNCQCHLDNRHEVPFIERIVREYFEKVQLKLETLQLCRAVLNLNSRVKYFLKLISDESKRAHYTELLLPINEDSIFEELLDYEIVDSSEKITKKLQLLKLPRIDSSNKNIHYDLNKKNLPDLNYGYLVQFCKYFEYRLKNLNSLCVICGKRTFDPSKKSSKPTICDDYECFSTAMDSKFRNDPLPPSIFSIEIADFLLLLVHAAIHSDRHELILDPYPKLINPYNTSTTLLDENGDKQQNILELRNIIDQIMTMGSITQYEAAKISLRSMIELKHPWGFSFFHWLMGTNRYHFSLIPEKYQIKEILTKFQYFIKHEDIVKHVNFKKLRAEKGSIFAFHGSPQENWHSILRSGLQIGRGGYLLNGAAFGSGIYVSPHFQFSAGYTRRLRYHPSIQYGSANNNNNANTPLQTRHWSCMALCEIINCSDVYNKHTDYIWTIQDPNLICTRFIFFFPTGVALDETLDISSETVISSIRELIHTLHNVAC